VFLQNRAAQPAPKVSSCAPFDWGFAVARTVSVTDWRNHHLALFSDLQAVHFEDCQGISVKGITLQNSQQYHLTFTRSSNVEANYLRVTSPEDSIDTKGIHLVDSKNVHVMDNLISTGICPSCQHFLSLQYAGSEELPLRNTFLKERSCHEIVLDCSRLEIQ